MNKPPFLLGRRRCEEKGRKRSGFLLRFVSWFIVTLWCTCADWRTKRSLLIRATAHLTIIALALTAIMLSGVGLPSPQAAVGSSFESQIDAAVELEVTPSPTPAGDTGWYASSELDTISREPDPHTSFPERARAQVVTYTIRQDDNIFNIAAQFGLEPQTIVWSNRETIQDAPWLIQPGMELFILPVDGVYHTVRAGETVESIADEYDADPDALYNDWNALEEGQRLREGMLLVVPDGQGEEVTWKPPEPSYASSSSQYSYGVCQGTSFTGPGANGWFVLPTGSTRVSGWYFHDPRNPTHIGLDYACDSGDPIYAADNGVVTISGWNGGYGNMVQISHGNGYVTRYGHFSQLAVGCGQPVYQGDLLGYCGTTGWSTGPHLHFEIRLNGVPHDPQIYLP
jgi:murein DD-endopeptidase MepM/ murein hydrolase activator NlpD